MRRRWAVYRALLDPTEGHEQAGTRLVPVLSNEPFNRHSGLVTVVPLTTARRDPHPWEVLIPKTSCGLAVDSLALPQHVRTIAVERLQDPPYGRIVDADLRRRIADKVLQHFGFQDPSRVAIEA